MLTPRPVRLLAPHPPQIFRRLHQLYVDTASNPFHAFGLPLASPKFDASVEAIVAAYPKPGNMSSGFVM